MRIVRSVAFLAVMSVVLSACGLVNALVPDQVVGDVMGLDGRAVRLSAPSTPSTQAVSLDVSGAFAGSFGDIDTAVLPAGIQPKQLLVDVALKATATLTSATGVLPDTVQVTAASLSLTVEDGSGSPSVTIGANASGSLLTLEKVDAGCVASLGCDYTVAAAAGEDTLLSVNASGQDFLSLWAITTAGGEPNKVEGTFGLTVEPSVPSDTIVDVMLSDGATTLKF